MDVLETLNALLDMTHEAEELTSDIEKVGTPQIASLGNEKQGKTRAHKGET